MESSVFLASSNDEAHERVKREIEVFCKLASPNVSACVQQSIRRRTL